MSSHSSDLNTARRKLLAALGTQQELYFSHMKSWFRKQTSKEIFDIEARKLLTSDSIALHNEFLLAILHKCNRVSEVSWTNFSSSRLSNGKGSSRIGRLQRGPAPKNPSFSRRFQSSNPLEYASNGDSYELYDSELSLTSYRRQERLPDASLIHGRMLISAWENGLSGVEDEAVSLSCAAVETQLRDLIAAMILQRNGYKLKDGIPIQFGSSVPNPWLLNSQRRLEETSPSDVLETDSESLVPVGRPLFLPSLRQAMLEVACGTSASTSTPLKPLSLFDLFETLQKNKNLIPSHTVYALNMERLIGKLSHED